MPVLHYSTQRNMFYENVSFIISRVYGLVITYLYNVYKFYYDIYYFTSVNFVLKTFVFQKHIHGYIAQLKVEFPGFYINDLQLFHERFLRKVHKKLISNETN